MNISNSKFKGTVSRDFLLQVFFMNHLPQAPDNNSRIISNFFENSRRYSQVKVHHQCQRHRWQICHRCQIAAGINDTGGKFSTGINDTGGKFCHQFPLCCWLHDAGGKLPPISTPPAANLPPVSLTPVANNGNNIRLQTPESELEGKSSYICFLYYPKMTKQNY